MEDRLRHVEFKRSGREAVARLSLGPAAASGMPSTDHQLRKRDLTGVVPGEQNCGVPGVLD